MVLKYNFTKISFFVAIALVGYLFFSWTFKDTLYNYLLFLFLIVSFIIIFVIDIFLILKKKDIYPFFIMLITTLILFFMPYKLFYVQLNYIINQSERKKIIKNLSNVKYQNLNRGLFPISSSGDIKVLKPECVYFSLFSYIQGIVYCKNIDKFIQYNNFYINKRLSTNWYWVGWEK